MKIKIMLLMILILANINSASRAELIFQDNFDDHSDWEPQQNIYPNTMSTSDSSGSATGNTACSTCPNGQAKYRGYYIAASSWNNYKGNNTLSISARNARGGTGKALTFWMEPIDTTKCDGGTKWCSDGQISVSLPKSYNELYMRFYIKFQPNWVWDSDEAASEKFFRVTHNRELPGVPLYRFGTNGNHFPAYFFDLGDSTIWGIRGIKFKMHPRFQSTYHLGSTPTPNYLIANDFAEAYVSGGTGTNGYKLFREYIGDGEWHSFEFHVKGNSGIGVEDGIMEMWVDGVRIFSQTNVSWADSQYNSSCVNCFNPPRGFVGWNWVSFGGNMLNRVYPDGTYVEQWYAIDDIVIATSYVGPNYVIGAPPAPPKGVSN